MPASGRAQVALDVDGQRLERARRRAPGSGAAGRPAAASAASRSSAQRNAASVLPEPVGATTEGVAPALDGGQAPSWAAVGAANAPSNQARVAGENAASGSTGRLRSEVGGHRAHPAPRPRHVDRGRHGRGWVASARCG